MSASLTDQPTALPVRLECKQGQGFHRRLDGSRRWGLTGVLIAALAGLSHLPAGASMEETGPPLLQLERFPSDGGLTHAEDGSVLPDGRLLVGDWNHGLVTIARDGTITPFGDFAAAGFKTKPDPLWKSPNGIAWEPDEQHVLVADITGGHIYRVDTASRQVARIYDHPFGVNAAIRDPSGAIWFTQSTENPPGAGSEARMFAAADRPMGDGSVWRIAPGEVGKPAPRAVKLVDGLDFANGIAFDGQRGRLYVAEIVASRILSFAVDPATGALSDRRVLARVTTPDNIELASDGMLWAASPFANAIYRIDLDSGAVSTMFTPDPAKSARMVAELERRQSAGEPLLGMLSPELWAPMPGLVTGVILPPGDGPAYVAGLGDALVRLDAGTGSGPDADRTAAGGTEPHPHSHSDGPDAVLAAPEHHEVLLENDRVRVLDTCIGPGERTRVHAHGWPAVQYVVRWSDFVRRDPDGKILADSRTSTQHPLPGQALWSGPVAPHSIENVGSDDLCVIAVEMKEEGGNADLTPILDDRTQRILEGIRSGNISGIMALYGPGSLYATNNATLLAKPEAIEAFWTQVAASPAQDANIEVLRIERLGPDAFVEIQKYDVFDADGARLFGGYASLLWRKIAGRWLIAADVSN